MDLWLFQFLNGQAGWGVWTDYLAWFLAIFGIGVNAVFLVIRWFFPGARPRRRERHTVLLATVGAVLAVGVAQMPQLFHYRERPHLVVPGAFDLVGVRPSDSFPSIHAAGGFAMATVMGWESQLWGWLNWPFALAMSWSRVYAGIHYPSDILASLVLGFLVGWALMELLPDLEDALDRITGVLPFGLGKE